MQSDEVGVYSNVRGGLDNAVTQARERGLHNLFIVDVDCHYQEPFNLFVNYLPEKWRNLARTELSKDVETKYSDDLAFPPELYDNLGKGKITEIPHAVDRYYGTRVIRSEVSYPKSQSPKEVIHTFTERMQDIGIKRSIVYPNILLNFGMNPDKELEVALGNAYVDYMLDHFLGKYKEILSVIPVPANSPQRSVELIQRAAGEKGIVGAMITPLRPSLMGSADYDPIYEILEEKQLPICIHSGAHYGGPFALFDNVLSISALAFPFYVVQQMTDIITKGVPERFPKVKFVFIEAGVSWVPWIMYRLDRYYEMRRLDAPLLTKSPSDYIKEFYFSSQPLEHPKSGAKDLKWIFDAFDASNHLMYASDYPHWDWDVPSVIYDLPFLSLESKKKILGENASTLFHIS